MSIREDVTIDWSVSPRIITVADPSTELTVQDLYDTLRDMAALDEAMDDDEILDGSGKDDLGGGVLVGLTVKLFNAKVKFEDKSSPTVCIISGGNLCAIDINGQSMSPIEPSNNVSVVIAQSSSATMIETGVSGLTEEESIQLMSIPTDPLKEDVVAIKSETDKIEEMSLNLIDALSDTAFIRKVEGGKWEISGNQMVFYDEDNLTEIMRFNITEDESGNPIMRTRV